LDHLCGVHQTRLALLYESLSDVLVLSQHTRSIVAHVDVPFFAPADFIGSDLASLCSLARDLVFIIEELMHDLAWLLLIKFRLLSRDAVVALVSKDYAEA
jgi:hypothetical protein